METPTRPLGQLLELRRARRESESTGDVRPLPKGYELLGPALEPAERPAAAPVVELRDEPLPGPADAHLLFLPRGGRYEFVERPGPPPGVGEDVSDVDEGARFAVSKVACSPLPLDRRPCAYLLALD